MNKGESDEPDPVRDGIRIREVQGLLVAEPLEPKVLRAETVRNVLNELRERRTPS